MRIGSKIPQHFLFLAVFDRGRAISCRYPSSRAMRPPVQSGLLCKYGLCNMAICAMWSPVQHGRPQRYGDMQQSAAVVPFPSAVQYGPPMAACPSAQCGHLRNIQPARFGHLCKVAVCSNMTACAT